LESRNRVVKKPANWWGIERKTQGQAPPVIFSRLDTKNEGLPIFLFLAAELFDIFAIQFKVSQLSSR